jgi:hypothetical protein
LYIDQDGCASQFKSKNAAYFNKMLVMAGFVKTICVTYAPTASGKGAVNGIGNARKTFLRKAEKNSKARLPNAARVVEFLTKHYHRVMTINKADRRPGTTDEYVDVLLHDIRAGYVGGSADEQDRLRQELRIHFVQIKRGIITYHRPCTPNMDARV